MGGGRAVCCGAVKFAIKQICANNHICANISPSNVQICFVQIHLMTLMIRLLTIKAMLVIYWTNMHLFYN